MRVEFVKMHGVGNDFVVVEDLDGAFEPAPSVVAAICDRHFGVGADGLIAVRRGPEEGTFYMHYLNADGSLAEMCGNGIRCLAKYAVDRGLTSADSFAVHTLGGSKMLTVNRSADGKMQDATVDMGEPILAPQAVPVDVHGELAQDVTIDTPEGPFTFTAVSMGNPHAVSFVDDVQAAPVATVGPFIENHELFPRKTNVEFAQVLPDEQILLRVWERGVGETLACGTGACATVVAASLGCLIGREAVVQLLGGKLSITWNPDDRVLMTGPAVEVFEGVLEL